MKKILKELDHGSKESCWAWYIFPTEKAGNCDFDETRITKKNAIDLCNNESTASDWRKLPREDLRPVGGANFTFAYICIDRDGLQYLTMTDINLPHFAALHQLASLIFAVSVNSLAHTHKFKSGIWHAFDFFPCHGRVSGLSVVFLHSSPRRSSSLRTMKLLLLYVVRKWR